MKPEVMGASFWTKLANQNPPIDNQNDPNKHFLPWVAMNSCNGQVCF